VGKIETQEKARAKRLLDNYNLTTAQSDAIDVYQGCVCWVCGRPEHVAGRRLAVEHSHVSGLVRGKLCSQCNPLLGKLENAYIRLGLHKVPGLNFVQIVERLAAYVKSPPAVAALGKEVFGWPGKTNTKRHRKFLKRLKLQNKQKEKAVTPTKPLLTGKEAK
jgi:hypothetical protein